MLSKKHRLTYQEFSQNPHYGKKFNSRTFFLTFKQANNTLSRFTILVPKTLDKRSSYRNRAKRITVEIIRQYLINNLKEGTDVLVRLRRIILKQEQSIREELIEVFNREGLLNPK